jgi:ribosomal protein L14
MEPVTYTIYMSHDTLAKKLLYDPLADIRYLMNATIYPTQMPGMYATLEEEADEMVAEPQPIRRRAPVATGGDEDEDESSRTSMIMKLPKSDGSSSEDDIEEMPHLPWSSSSKASRKRKKTSRKKAILAEADENGAGEGEGEGAGGGAADNQADMKKSRASGKKYKRHVFSANDNPTVDFFGVPIDFERTTLKETYDTLTQYRSLYQPTQFVPIDPERMGTSVDDALFMFRSYLGDVKEAVDPRLFAVGASSNASTKVVFRLIAVDHENMGWPDGPIIRLDLNAKLIVNLDQESVSRSMVYAAFGVRAFFAWYTKSEFNLDTNRPTHVQIDSYLDTPNLMPKLGDLESRSNVQDPYAARFLFGLPIAVGTAINSAADLTRWLAEAQLSFNAPETTAISIVIEPFNAKKPRPGQKLITVASTVITVGLPLIEDRLESDVKQMLLLALIRWYKKFSKYDGRSIAYNENIAVIHYVGAGGRIDLYFTPGQDNFIKISTK